MSIIKKSILIYFPIFFLTNVIQAARMKGDEEPATGQIIIKRRKKFSLGAKTRSLQTIEDTKDKQKLKKDNPIIQGVLKERYKMKETPEEFKNDAVAEVEQIITERAELAKKIRARACVRKRSNSFPQSSEDDIKKQFEIYFLEVDDYQKKLVVSVKKIKKSMQKYEDNKKDWVLFTKAKIDELKEFEKELYEERENKGFWGFFFG